MKYADMLS
jgi:hypothetical protein